MSLSPVANAQHQDPAVIALPNKASWCPVCRSNGPRFEKDIMPMVVENKDVQMVMNDLSDDKTKAASKEMLEKAGKNNSATLILTFHYEKNNGLRVHHLYTIDWPKSSSFHAQRR